MSTDDYRTSVSDVLSYTSCRWENATSSNHVEFVPKLSVSIIGLDSKKLCMLNIPTAASECSIDSHEIQSVVFSKDVRW